jgi:hypothetical protein
MVGFGRIDKIGILIFYLGVSRAENRKIAIGIGRSFIVGKRGSGGKHRRSCEQRAAGGL